MSAFSSFIFFYIFFIPQKKEEKMSECNKCHCEQKTFVEIGEHEPKLKKLRFLQFLKKYDLVVEETSVYNQICVRKRHDPQYKVCFETKFNMAWWVRDREKGMLNGYRLHGGGSGIFLGKYVSGIPTYDMDLIPVFEEKYVIENFDELIDEVHRLESRKE